MTETKLNYGYNPVQKTEPSSTEQVNNAKTAMSMQSVANQAILGTLPTGGGMSVPPPQNVGFGRTR